MREPLIDALEGTCSERELLCYTATLVSNLHTSFWVGSHANAAIGLADTPLGTFLARRAQGSCAVHTKLHWQLEVTCAACEETTVRCRADISRDPSSQAADNLRLEAAAAVARGVGCRALQQRLLLCAPGSSTLALIRGQALHGALSLVDSQHGDTGQFLDGAQLKKQIKDVAQAVFPSALAASSSAEMTPEQRAAAERQVQVATPRLPVLPEWGCVGIDHRSARRMSSKTRPFMFACECVHLGSPTVISPTVISPTVISPTVGTDGTSANDFSLRVVCLTD